MRKLQKRLYSLALVLAMVVILLPETVRAAGTSGDCGDNLTWSYSNGTLTIQGTGKMEDFFYSDNRGIWTVAPSPWDYYREEIRTIIIGNGVTSIGLGAFSECAGLTSVTIPSGVTSIGNCAFEYCGSLTSVTIPSGVTSIGVGAFMDCNGLTSVTIPDSVVSIGNYAFEDCVGLTSVTIPSGVTSMGEGTFYGCKRLRSIMIPASVTEIRESALDGCTNLTDIYYGGSQSQWVSAPVIKCKKTPRKKCSFVAERRKKG